VLGEMLLQIPAVVGGDKKAGLRELETAAKLEPDASAHFTALAKAYLAAGRRSEAKAASEHVLAIGAPADPGEYEDNARDARTLLDKLSSR